MNISEFKSKISGFAYTNNYLVRIIPPDLLKNQIPNFNATEELKLMAQDTNIDFGKIKSIENERYGKVHTIASNWNYDQLNVEFLLLNNFQILDFFMKWKNLIVDQKTNNVGYYDDYVAKTFSISLTRSNDNEKPIYIFNFINAYPVNIDSLKLNYDNIELLKLSIDFTYSDMEQGNVEELRNQITENASRLINLKALNIFGISNYQRIS